MSSITFTCYACNQVLKVGGDKAGKKAKCIKCGTILTIPVATNEEPEVVSPVEAEPPRGGPSRRRDEDEPAPRRRSRDDEYDDEPRRRPRDDDEPRRRPRDEYEDDEPRRRPRDEYEDDEPRRRRPRDDDYDDEPRRRPRDEREDEEESRRKRRRDEDDYDDNRAARRREREAWAKVRIGLILQTVTGWIYTGASGAMTLAFFLVLFVLIIRTGVGILKVSEVLIWIGVILYFALQITAVIGYVFSLFAPNKNGALALSITCLSLGGLCLILKLIFILIPLIGSGAGMMIGGPGPGPGGPGPGGPGLGGPGPGMVPFAPGSVAAAIIIVILYIMVLDAEYVMYPFYLRAVSKTLKDRYLASGWNMPMIMACVATGVKILVLMVVIIMIGSVRTPGVGIVYFLAILPLLIFGTCLAFGLVYVRYVLQVMGNLQYGGPRRDRDGGAGFNLLEAIPLSYQGQSNLGVGIGLLLHIVGMCLIFTSVKGFALLLLILAPIFFFWGCAAFAKNKGYSGFLGILGLFGIIGFIILVLLPYQRVD